MTEKYRAIQKIEKGDLTILPGEFIDDLFDAEELQKLVDDGFAALKIIAEKKSAKKSTKQVKDDDKNT